MNITMGIKRCMKQFVAVVVVILCLELIFYAFSEKYKFDNQKQLNQLINTVIKHVSRTNRIERDAVNRETSQNILQLLSLRRQKTPNIHFEKFTVIINTIHEQKSINRLISHLSHNARKEFVKSMAIVVGMSNVNYEMHSERLLEICGLLPRLKFVFIQNISATKASRILLSYVKTKYVLLARGSYPFETHEREISRFLSPLVLQFVHVVGASFYSKNEGLDHGCYQGNLLWYQLILQKGYDFIRNDGFARCYGINGIFATRTEFLIQYFNGDDISTVYNDDQIITSFLFTKDGDFENPGLMYVDFFKVMNKDSKIIEICTNCVFPMLDDTTEKFWDFSRKEWLKFARKHDVSEIILHPSIEEKNEKHYIYSCEEVGLKCHRKRKSMLAEKCCQMNLHKLLMDTYVICEKYGLHYMSSDGSFLGPIKVTDTLPWDLDHDFEFRTENFSALMKHKDEFLAHGMDPIPEFEPCMETPNKEKFTCGYVGLKHVDWRIEIWGQYLLFSDFYETWKVPEIYRHLFPKSRIQGVSTKIEMKGHWSSNRANPGLYARSCYGLDVLKHEQHWQVTGKKNYQYTPSSRFGKCSVEGHHACRNRFLSDGNIQFQRPWV